MKSGEIQSKHIEISPDFMSVAMEHVDREIDPGFQVTSFRISGGRVRQLSGTPIPGAEVLIFQFGYTFSLRF